MSESSHPTPVAPDAPVDADPAEAGAPGEAAPASRRDKTLRDMALSLAVLLVPILVIGGLLRACGSSAPTVVDTAPAIDTARAADLFPVVVPQGLSDGWRPVQATFGRTADGTAGTLRLGYLTPSGGEALFLISNESTAALLAHELGEDARRESEVTIDGQAWTVSRVRGDERALVLTETVRASGSDAPIQRTIIVLGRAPLDELTALAGALRPETG